jgi:hypothetical protein
MTSHELQYYRFLLRLVKDLYIERAATCTILDMPRDGTLVHDWRSRSAVMTKDKVYRSAVEANFAPFFEKLKRALNSEKVLAELLNPIEADAN